MATDNSIEREKVLEGLECLAQMNEPMANPCSKCGYHDRPNFAFCVRDIASDVIALLKEQETVVRCKDCKHYGGNGTCMKNEIAMLTEHLFCTDGERENFRKPVSISATDYEGINCE